jgi:uncharacterized protein YfdQ (DUF2303 family)
MTGDISAQVILDAGKAIALPRPNPNKDGPAYAIVPQGCTLQYLEPSPQFPDRRRGTVRVRDVTSFLTYLNEMIDGPAACIYGSVAPPRFIAVLNDHQKHVPGFRDFRVDFNVPHSIEWQTWIEGNRKKMGQLAFAEFVENNLPDITSPTGAEMLEIILNFEASKSGAFKSYQRTQDGSVDLVWVDQNAGKDGGQIRVPPIIKLQIPVFEKMPAVSVEARIKFRVSDGALLIWYELVRPHKVVEESLNEIWAMVEEKHVVINGSPE